MRKVTLSKYHMLTAGSKPINGYVCGTVLVLLNNVCVFQKVLPAKRLCTKDAYDDAREFISTCRKLGFVQ